MKLNYTDYIYHTSSFKPPESCLGWALLRDERLFAVIQQNTRQVHANRFGIWLLLYLQIHSKSTYSILC